MKKFFIILLGIIVVTAMVGCLNLTAIPPFLNSAPVMISEPIIAATEDQLYLYQVEASDPNGDTLIYSFIIKPEGMSIDKESGLISWTPANNQVGIHQVIVEISDGKHSVTQSFEIEVSNVNNPPQIFSYFPDSLNVGVNEGDSIKFEVQAHDINLNATLSFQWFLNGKLVLASTVSIDGSKSSWIYSAGYGDYGQKIVKVLVSDGELQDYVQWNITISDITPPAQPTLNTVISPTNIPTQTLSGNKESNTSIWVNGAEVISINSDATWSHPYSLSEGTNNISITSRDAAGNESSSVSTTIVLDISTPEIPILNDVTSPTNISPQILSGTKEINSSILINGAEVISLNSSTNWSHSHNLSEGIKNISITSRDAAGNESSAVTAIIILDTINPAVPTLDVVVSPTNVSPQTLSGAKEANTSIWINNLEVVPINSSTTWTYDFNLSEGENNISINSRDAVSNESAVVNNSITLDTIPPITPTLHDIISPTNISIQLLSGNKEINSSIWVNGVEVISVNSKTTWSYDFELIEGENSISIISKDIVGNESNEINTTVILDISAPVIPSLEPVSSPTNISSQTLSGTKEANTSIWINGTEVASLNSSTNWSHSHNLSEGINNISITSRDAAGNESSAVTAIIILDTINPAVPALDAVVSPTNISPQILSGAKEGNTSIWINNLEVVPINSSTTWTYDFNLSEGENNISVTSLDAAGNESFAITATIEYDLNIYVDATNTTGIEDGTKNHPFSTITEGIIAVAPGKSVMVAVGNYNEQLVISKEITLQGASQDNTFISGSGLTGNLITIEADNITITGFTIDGSSSTSIGLYFDSYSFININNNIIQNNSSYGINYSNSSPTIENNNIKNNNYSGIDVGTGGAGIIRNNFVVSSKHGIRTNGDSSPEITRNNISNNNTGIYCRESATPIISYNTISNNSGYGILIDNILGNLVDPDIGGGDGQSEGQNKITGNSIHGVSNKTTHNIYAKYNWWGDVDGPKYPNNPDGNVALLSDWAYWSKTGGDIIFTPHLTTEP